MSRPPSFSWIEKPLLAASALPESAEELAWLRQQGVEVLLSLTEDPVRRDWIEDAGLLVVHVPVSDMEAPTAEQIEKCVSVIRKANEAGMGVAVHCHAGMGRTGSILAAHFVSKGVPPREAIERVRALRPGSIETDEQEEAIMEYARKLRSA